MNSPDALISMASWEERFRDGSVSLISKLRPAQTILFRYSDEPYAEWMKDNVNVFMQTSAAAGIPTREQTLHADDSPGNWREVSAAISQRIQGGSRVVVDLTTMPREVIWWTFWFCDRLQASISFTYHPPARYGDWLSRDPLKPRLVYRMSGVSEFGKKTGLVVLAGYDVERTEQLISFFEPSVAVVGLQKDSIDPRNHDHMEQHRNRLGDNRRITFFETDAYSGDQGLREIEAAVGEIRADHNVILSSLGPKLSAVAMYKMLRTDPHLALAYAPSQEFSKEYSTGVREMFHGTV